MPKTASGVKNTILSGVRVRHLAVAVCAGTLALAGCASGTEPCLQQTVTEEFGLIAGREFAESNRQAWMRRRTAEGWVCNESPDVRDAFGRTIAITATCTRCA